MVHNSRPVYQCTCVSTSNSYGAEAATHQHRQARKHRRCHAHNVGWHYGLERGESGSKPRFCQQVSGRDLRTATFTLGVRSRTYSRKKAVMASQKLGAITTPSMHGTPSKQPQMHTRSGPWRPT